MSGLVRQKRVLGAKDADMKQDLARTCIRGIDVYLQAKSHDIKNLRVEKSGVSGVSVTYSTYDQGYLTWVIQLQAFLRQT